MNKNTKICCVLIVLAGGIGLAQTSAPKIGILPSKAAQLKGIEGMLQRGQAAEAMKDLQANLTQYNSTDLPTALYLSGKAGMILADKTGENEKAKLSLQAGLDFMRVATFFPYADQAPDSLLQAGRACAAAGDQAGAANAYRTAISRYPDNPAATAARAELEKVKQ